MLHSDVFDRKVIILLADLLLVVRDSLVDVDGKGGNGWFSGQASNVRSLPLISPMEYRCYSI